MMNTPAGSSVALRPNAATGKPRQATRRAFLKASGAALATPMIVPSSVFGSADQPAPSDRIVVGQIGFGWIGGNHINVLLNRRDVQFLGACDVKSDLRARIKKRIDLHYASKTRHGVHDSAIEFADFRDMLADDRIDAVVIAVPDHWHAIMTIEAARAGKDIYCEKPISLTLHLGREMVKAVRRHGVVFQTGSQQRSEWGGKFRRACELVRSGRIGKVYRATVGVGVSPRACDLPPQPTPATIDWDMWLGPAPWRPYHGDLADKMWRPFRDYCGGGLADMGAHHFDIAAWGLGLDHTGPVQVTPPSDETADHGAVLRYASGVEIEHVAKPGGTVFYGTEGKIHVDRGPYESWPEHVIHDPLGPNDVHLYKTKGHHDNWLECIRSRQDPVAPVEVGHRTASLCHLLNLCYMVRRPLRWDPVNEYFVNDAGANRLMDRAMRSPWRV